MSIEKTLADALRGLIASAGGGRKACGHPFDCNCAMDAARAALKSFDDRAARLGPTATVSRSCQRCALTFQARPADVARGWAKFCSKSCKAKAQEARTGQHAEYLDRQNRDDDPSWYADRGIGRGMNE